MRAFPVGRPFYITKGGRVAANDKVASGAPEGLELGPLLFRSRFNDLALASKSSSIILADDVKLVGL